MIMNMQVEGKTLTKLEMINHLMENLGIHSKEAYPRSRSTKLLSRSVSGVTKVRYGDRPVSVVIR